MNPGGAEILLANSLSPGGLPEYTENHLAFFMGPSYLLEALDNSVKVHFLDYKGAATIVSLIKKIRALIVDNKIDIVHTHLNPASFYTHIACPKNIPQVHTIHTTYSMDTAQSSSKLWAEKYIYLLKENTNIILLSDFTKSDFLKSIPFKGKSFVLNNFVSDDYFNIKPIYQLQPFQQIKLIAIGSLQKLKNFEYLLQVFYYLKNYNISLDIFGGGDKDPYNTIIKENGLNVTMMGHSSNLKGLINQYDLFIMPSKFEGFPLSVFEAMAVGLPLMLSDILPLKSIVKENALYFPLNDPKKVANQLINILQNKIDIRAMATKANIYAEKTVRRQTYIDKLLTIYDGLIIEKNVRNSAAKV